MFNSLFRTPSPKEIQTKRLAVEAMQHAIRWDKKNRPIYLPFKPCAMQSVVTIKQVVICAYDTSPEEHKKLSAHC